MRLTRFIYILSAVTVICGAAHAAEKLTWQDCVNKAAGLNPDIRASHRQLESSENLAKAAYSGFMPQITASANVTRGNSYSFAQLGGVPLSTPSGDNTTTSGSLQLTQNIFSGFQDASLVKQGAANRELSRATLDSTKVQVSYDLKVAFANLFYSQKYVELSEKIIKRRSENSGIVELRYESGVENMGSVMLSKAFVGQSRYDKTVAHDSIDVSRQQLARTMGQDSSTDFEIVGDIPLAEPGEEPDFISLASTTPAHHQSVAQEDASEAGVPLARSNFYPDLGVTGTVSAQGNNSFPNASKRSLMVTLSLPIFNGGKDYHDLKSAAAQYSASSYQRQSVDQQLLPKLKQTFRAYVEAIEKLKVDKAFLEAAEVRAEIARNKYNNGLLSFEDWDTIENDLITRQKTYLLSERDRIIAEATWELTAGKGVIP